MGDGKKRPTNIISDSNFMNLEEDTMMTSMTPPACNSKYVIWYDRALNQSCVSIYTYTTCTYIYTYNNYG